MRLNFLSVGQRCIIPCEYFYEPYYQAGVRAVRWRIGRPGNVPMGIAGIYRRSSFSDGTQGWSFAMLTVNADDHPFMSRFHAPGDEKRMVLILDAEQYGPWLQSDVDHAHKFFQQWHGELQGEPAPLAPPRATGELF
ncbi:MAG TPA: SOS response-associated peptidase family protein [Acidovorax sp.]|nr:SOS response-associated peptidase family protein [Acidovorax sp.]